MKKILSTVIPLALGALLAFSVWQGLLNADQGQAICALRHDLEKRVEQSAKFLVEHPHGAFGFSPAQIRKGLSDQQRTIDALAPVSC